MKISKNPRHRRGPLGFNHIILKRFFSHTKEKYLKGAESKGQYVPRIKLKIVSKYCQVLSINLLQNKHVFIVN